MHTLEYAKFLEFKKQYNTTEGKTQRYGQAFCDFFKLEKSHGLKEIADEIYQLDGFNAIAVIHAHFEFN